MRFLKSSNINRLKVVFLTNLQLFNRDDDEYFTKRYTSLKLRNNFSY